MVHPRVCLFPLARATLACVALGACAAVARAEWRPLPEALARRGLHVVPGTLYWLDPPGLGARRALLLARAGHALADLYAVTCRTGPGDRVISLRDVSNLTRSRDAAEEALVVRGSFAAFVTRVGQDVVAFNVLDTRGERGDPPADRGARLRTALTRLQQTGRLEGYGIDRFDLVRPAPSLSLALDVHELRAALPAGSVRVRLSDLRVAEGGTLVRERPRRPAQAGSWVTWAVDTVRAVPWIGPAPIAWAEGWAFRAEHAVARARSAVVGDHTQRDVAEDLADVLRGHAASALEGRVDDWPPAPIHGTVTSPVVQGEGQWSPMGGEQDPFMRANPGAPPPMYITFVRTDPERADSRVYVTVWDPRQVELHVVPGSEEPIGATGETGSGAIPRDERTMSRLLAGFNGAFQALHGEFGVYAEGTLLLPPKPYAATIMTLADGSTGFGTWPRETRTIPDEVVEFRQNLTALVENGQYNPWRRGWWGGTVPGQTDPHTARSALCMTREGYVAYFWGHALTPRTLAEGMIAARCDYGVHLDMNGANTGFELYRVERAGALPPLGRAIASGHEAEGTIGGLPGMVFRARKLVRRMSENLPRYIRRDPRDFFYLLLRPVLPGPPLLPPVSPAQPGEGTWHVAGLGELAFPWPMARTRVRPDPARPERWVNLVRLDPRRVTLAPPDARENVIARVVNAQVAGEGQMRISMATGLQGPRWTIGTSGDGLAGQPLTQGMSVLRGAGIDANGFLVIAVADRALPDLVWQALDLAGCGPERIALGGATLLLPSGQGAAGESAVQNTEPVLALVARDFPRARRLFTEVTPVPPSVWHPVQSHQVRYMRNPSDANTMQVRIIGADPLVLPLRGLSSRPDAGAPAPSP